MFVAVRSLPEGPHPRLAVVPPKLLFGEHAGMLTPVPAPTFAQTSCVTCPSASYARESTLEILTPQPEFVTIESDTCLTISGRDVPGTCSNRGAHRAIPYRFKPARRCTSTSAMFTETAEHVAEPLMRR